MTTATSDFELDKLDLFELAARKEKPTAPKPNNQPTATPGLDSTAPAAASPTTITKAKTVGTEALHFAHRDLPDWAQDVLEIITVEEKNEKFLAKLNSGELPRDHYQLVNDILINLGGKWRGNQKAHVFTHNPEELILAVITTGKLPAKNPLDFFPTPKAAVRILIEDSPLAWMLENYRENGEGGNIRILEPSAGRGNIVETLLELYPLLRGKIDVVEANPINAETLRTLQKDGAIGEVFQEDFLTWTPTKEYRLIIMNPPFAYKGNKLAYVDHIKKAWDIVQTWPEKKEAGVIAITPTTWLINEGSKKTEEFRNHVFLHGSFEALPEKTFAESGTNIPTTSVHLTWNKNEETKETEKWQAEHFMLLANNHHDLFDKKRDIQESIQKTKDPEKQDKIIRDFFLQTRHKLAKEDTVGIPDTPLVFSIIKAEILQEIDQTTKQCNPS